MSESLGFETPVYLPRSDAGWFHFLYGHVPQYQIDFICEPSSAARLDPNHKRDLTPLLVTLDPPSLDVPAFAFGNLSLTERDAKPGKGGLGLLFAVRVSDLLDHGGRGSPTFAHAMVAVGRAHNAVTLATAAQDFLRHANQHALPWYHRYYSEGWREGENILSEYLKGYSHIASVPRQRRVDTYVPELIPRSKRRIFSRLIILHGDSDSLDTKLEIAARIADVLYHSSLPWLWVTVDLLRALPSRPEVELPQLVVHFISRTSLQNHEAQSPATCFVELEELRSGRVDLRKLLCLKLREDSVSLSLSEGSRKSGSGNDRLTERDNSQALNSKDEAPSSNQPNPIVEPMRVEPDRALATASRGPVPAGARREPAAKDVARELASDALTKQLSLPPGLDSAEPSADETVQLDHQQVLLAARGLPTLRGQPVPDVLTVPRASPPEKLTSLEARPEEGLSPHHAAEAVTRVRAERLEGAPLQGDDPATRERLNSEQPTLLNQPAPVLPPLGTPAQNNDYAPTDPRRRAPEENAASQGIQKEPPLSQVVTLINPQVPAELLTPSTGSQNPKSPSHPSAEPVDASSPNKTGEKTLLQTLPEPAVAQAAPPPARDAEPPRKGPPPPPLRSQAQLNRQAALSTELGPHGMKSAPSRGSPAHKSPASDRSSTEETDASSLVIAVQTVEVALLKQPESQPDAQQGSARPRAEAVFQPGTPHIDNDSHSSAPESDQNFNLKSNHGRSSRPIITTLFIASIVVGLMLVLLSRIVPTGPATDLGESERVVISFGDPRLPLVDDAMRPSVLDAKLPDMSYLDMPSVSAVVKKIAKPPPPPPKNKKEEKCAVEESPTKEFITRRTDALDLHKDDSNAIDPVCDEFLLKLEGTFCKLSQAEKARIDAKLDKILDKNNLRKRIGPNCLPIEATKSSSAPEAPDSAADTRGPTQATDEKKN